MMYISTIQGHTLFQNKHKRTIHPCTQARTHARAHSFTFGYVVTRPRYVILKFADVTNKNNTRNLRHALPIR